MQFSIHQSKFGTGAAEAVKKSPQLVSEGITEELKAAAVILDNGNLQ
jgi:hypothetical protein